MKRKVTIGFVGRELSVDGFVGIYVDVWDTTTGTIVFSWNGSRYKVCYPLDQVMRQDKRDFGVLKPLSLMATEVK